MAIPKVRGFSLEVLLWRVECGCWTQQPIVCLLALSPPPTFPTPSITCCTLTNEHAGGVSTLGSWLFCIFCSTQGTNWLSLPLNFQLRQIVGGASLSFWAKKDDIALCFVSEVTSVCLESFRATAISLVFPPPHTLSLSCWDPHIGLLAVTVKVGFSAADAHKQWLYYVPSGIMRKKVQEDISKHK